MEISGLPLHPLIVHAVVILGPLAALTAVAYAAVPKWRWLLRWPLVTLVLFSMAAVQVAVMAGETLATDRGLDQLAPVQTHSERGEWARNVMIGFSVVALLAAVRLGGASALVSKRGAKALRGGGVDVLLRVLLLVSALAALVTLVLAGDSGARAVWGS